jgi:hypothetical protein
MVRFSNSKLSTTQYIVTGISPVAGSATAIITPIPAAYTAPQLVPPASKVIANKRVVGVSSTAYDVAISPEIPDPNVELGLLYSNGYRYQYADFKAGTTGCSTEVPDRVVTVQVQTDSGIIYVDETISGYTLVKAYVGNNIVVPQLPNANVVINTAPPPSKLEPELTNNNSC